MNLESLNTMPETHNSCSGPGPRALTAYLLCARIVMDLALSSISWKPLQSCKISITSQFAKRKLSLRDVIWHLQGHCAGWQSQTQCIWTKSWGWEAWSRALRAKRHENTSERCSSHYCCSSPTGPRVFCTGCPWHALSIPHLWDWQASCCCLPCQVEYSEAVGCPP